MLNNNVIILTSRVLCIHVRVHQETVTLNHATKYHVYSTTPNAIIYFGYIEYNNTRDIIRDINVMMIDTTLLNIPVIRRLVDRSGAASILSLRRLVMLGSDVRLAETEIKLPLDVVKTVGSHVVDVSELPVLTSPHVNRRVALRRVM